jgi:hypothetical protein
LPLLRGLLDLLLHITHLVQWQVLASAGSDGLEHNFT